MPSKTERREAARVKAAVVRRKQQRRARRTRTLLVSAITVAVLAVAAGVWGLIASLTPAEPPAGGSVSAPPWAAPHDAPTRIRAAGLSLLNSEGTALHIHQHLSITVDGKPVTVPGNIGVDVAAQRLSPLHTHDDSGILHVEAPTVQKFTLGQFFTEWGVRLRAATIGAYVNGTNGTKVTVFVDGARSQTPLLSVLREK